MQNKLPETNQGKSPLPVPKLLSNPYIHPVLAGVFSSLVTLTGQYFFKIQSYTLSAILNLVVGIIIFIFLNKYFLKFQFNSYQLHGVTLSTVIIFCVQNLVIGMNRITQLSYRWWLGMVIACLGVLQLSGETEEKPGEQGKDSNKRE